MRRTFAFAPHQPYIRRACHALLFDSQRQPGVWDGEGREKNQRMSTRESRCRIERFLAKSPSNSRANRAGYLERSDPLRALLISLIVHAMIHAVPMHVVTHSLRSGKRI